MGQRWAILDAQFPGRIGPVGAVETQDPVVYFFLFVRPFVDRNIQHSQYGGADGPSFHFSPLSPALRTDL